MHGGEWDIWLVKLIRHSIVYEIARQQLITEKKENIVKLVNDTLFNMTEKDALKDPYMATIWMDAIKDIAGMPWSGKWHYVDTPIIVDNLTISFSPQANITSLLVFLIMTYIEKCYFCS